MRILTCSVDAFPQMGGVSTMAHHLSNALAGQGNEVVFLGPRGCLVPSGYSRQYTLIEDTQSTVATRSGPGVSAEDTRIRELGRRILDRYRCEHALLVHPFYYAVGLMRAFHEVALPVSVYFHGYDLRSQLVGMRAAGQTANPPLWPGESLPERLLYTAAACDEVLANSRYTAGLFAPFRIEAPVRVTGCGIPLDRIRREVAQTTGYSAQERIQRRAALGLPRGSCLCYVGRLVPAKRVGRLLEICRDSRELCCVVIGEGPELASLQQMAERWGLRNRVHFAGKLEEAEKWTVLRAMDFVCLLSEPDDGTGAVEGFGIALLEGAAAGAVPVSSGSGGMGDVVEDGRTGVVIPKGMPGAAQRLEQLCASDTAMGSLNAEARAQLESSYNWNAVAQRILEGWQCLG